MSDPGYEARRKAENQRSSGNLEGAVATLTSRLEAEPLDHRSRMLLANILIKDMDRADDGLRHLDAIVASDPDFDDARKALVTVLKSRKKYNSETAEHFVYLLAKYPDDSDLLHSYGKFCREQLLDFAKAEECFRRCVALRPDSEMYRLSLASLLINDLRNYDEGRIQLMKADEINPGNPKTAAALKRLSKRKYSGDKGPRRGFLERFVR